MSKAKRAVIITGATGYIGERLVRRFGSDGWNIALAYNSKAEKAGCLAEEINKMEGSLAKAYAIDLADAQTLGNMVNDVVKEFGRIDVLINNAAVSRDALVVKISDKDWNDVININLTGNFNMLRSVSKIMMNQMDGVIINIGSILGVKGSAGGCCYSVSKAALIELGISAAKELGRYNIRVNTVLPGFHKTAINNSAGEQLSVKAKQESVINSTTQVEELADFTCFLAKTKSISGQVFNCDSRII